MKQIFAEFIFANKMVKYGEFRGINFRESQDDDNFCKSILVILNSL